MKLKFLPKFGMVVALSSILVAGCNRIDLSEVSTEISLPGALAIPLGNVKLSLNKIIEKVNLGEQISIDTTDNDINLVLEENAEFAFKQISFSKNSFSPISFGYAFDDIPPGIELSNPIEKTFAIDIHTNTEVERIDYVILSTFIVKLEISNYNDIDINKLEIITKFDEDAVQQLDVDESVIQGVVSRTFTPSDDQTSTELQYYNIKVVPNASNEVPLSVIVKVKDGESVTISNTSEINFDYMVQEVQYKIAYGKFPAAIADKNSNTQDIDLSMLEGMRFANPQFAISLQSNIGTYFRFTVDTIRAYRDGNVDNAKYAEFDGSHSISLDVDVRPIQPGDWVEKEFAVFDAENGSIDLLFDSEQTPNILEYIFAITTYIKPGEEQLQQFITPDAKIKVDVKGTIPLHFKKGSNIELKDTMNVELESLFNDNDIIEEATLRLTVENGLPIDIALDLESFLDVNDNVLPNTIKKDYKINAPELNTDGTVKQTKKQIIDIQITKKQFEEIKHANKMIYGIKAHQEVGNEIHFRPQDFFDLHLGIFVKGELSTESFNSNNDN